MVSKGGEFYKGDRPSKGIIDKMLKQINENIKRGIYMEKGLNEEEVKREKKRTKKDKKVRKDKREKDFTKEGNIHELQGSNL